MNRFPLWKYVLIGITLVVAFLYTLPNFFGEVPAVQLSPVRTSETVLARTGLDDAELLRERYAAPATPLLVRVVPDARWGVQVARASDESVLQQALLLGLCTAYQYDPVRPVMWTRASLTRRVELYEPAGFYA